MVQEVSLDTYVYVLLAKSWQTKAGLACWMSIIRFGDIFCHFSEGALEGVRCFLFEIILSYDVC